VRYHPGAASAWLDDEPLDEIEGDPEDRRRHVEGQSLPDGPSYAGTVVLAIPASKIQVRITNGNYQKLAQ
jgi:hypothetical protein